MNRTAEDSERASSLPLHQKTTREIAAHTCTIYVQEQPAFLLIQPADANDLREMDLEMEAIAQATGAHFVLVAVHIARWFDELPPWDAPPVFGKRPFGHGAPATLQSILDIIDHLRSSGLVSSPDCPTILGGYSLAGLFALWAGYQHPFDGIVAASPSIWYPQWLDYAALHTPLSAAFYLSLGDREDRSRTPIMTTVSQCIRRQHNLLIASSTPSTLEWNEGNHFQDNGLRTAKGFAWVINRIQTP